jgi:hypothetical protein
VFLGRARLDRKECVVTGEREGGWDVELDLVHRSLVMLVVQVDLIFCDHGATGGFFVYRFSFGRGVSISGCVQNESYGV